MRRLVLLLCLLLASRAFGAPSGSLETLSQAAPADSAVFVGLDFRDTTTMGEQFARIQAAELLSPAVRNDVTALEHTLGVHLGELSMWTAPAGFVAILPGAGQDSLLTTREVVVALAVTDEKAAADSLLKLQGQAAQAVGVETDPAQACENNLQQIGAALEMYGIDHGGHYPEQLAVLTPNYLKVIPTCPAAGTDTYSYQAAANPDTYTILCNGDHHGMGPDKPAYTSAGGLLATSTTSSAAFKAETLNGTPVWVSPVSAHLAYTVHDGYVVAATSVATLGRVLDTLDGKAPSLSGLPAFADGRKHIPGDQGVLVWLALQPTAQRLLETPSLKAQADEQTLQGLAALRYAIIHWSIDQNVLLSEQFLKVDPDSPSPFAHALLTGGHLDPVLARYFPANHGSFTTADATWLYHVILAGMKLFPGLRPQVATLPSLLKLPHGLDFERDILSKTSGTYGATSDWAQIFPQSLNGGMQQAASQGRLAMCENNLKSIGVALEMYSTDHHGRYPTRLSQLVPAYLKRVPVCPAGQSAYVYHVHVHPDGYSFYCAGHHHPEVAVNEPAYTSAKALVVHRQPAVAYGGVSSLFAVHFQSLEAAHEALRTMETASHLTRITTGRVGDVEVHGYHGQSLHWALAPDGVLLAGLGPQAESFVKSALTTHDQGGSIADLPEYQSMLSEMADARVIGADYVDMTPLVQWVTGMARPLLAQAAGQPGAGTAALALQLLQNLPMQGVTYAEVLPDGLHVVGHGVSSVMVGFVAGVGAAVMVPNFMRARAQAQLTSCESNEKHIAVALEIYSVDHDGHYPDRLSQLVPRYLKHLPVCPAAGHETYSAAYRHQSKPKEGYSFHCGGQNHTGAGMPANYPQYSSERGLILTP